VSVGLSVKEQNILTLKLTFFYIVERAQFSCLDLFHAHTQTHADFCMFLVEVAG
jgi:hypothetical protein